MTRRAEREQRRRPADEGDYELCSPAHARAAATASTSSPASRPPTARASPPWRRRRRHRRAGRSRDASCSSAPRPPPPATRRPRHRLPLLAEVRPRLRVRGAQLGLAHVAPRKVASAAPSSAPPAGERGEWRGGSVAGNAPATRREFDGDLGRADRARRRRAHGGRRAAVEQGHALVDRAARHQEAGDGVGGEGGGGRQSAAPPDAARSRGGGAPRGGEAAGGGVAAEHAVQDGSGGRDSQQAQRVAMSDERRRSFVGVWVAGGEHDALRRRLRLG